MTLQPKAAFASLSAQAAQGRWLLVRRPAFVALVLGCTISLLTAHSLTLRLVASGALTWSFVPLLEMAGLAVVWRLGSRPLSVPRAVDLFFTGHGLWSLWLIALAAYWSSVPAPPLTYRRFAIWAAAAGAVLLWSAYVDFCFHRSVLRSSPARSVCHILLQRALCWIPGILVFGYGSLWADLVRLWK